MAALKSEIEDENSGSNGEAPADGTAEREGMREISSGVAEIAERSHLAPRYRATHILRAGRY